MSKIQLKKELLNFDREQLTQLILDLYSARKEAKDYFDFFINPDVPALYEKYCKQINKEMLRGKYGRSTARISKIKQSIKEFASFGVGPEAQIDLILYAVRLGIIEERRKFYNKTLVIGIGSLLENVIEIADKNLVVDKVVPRINALLDGKVGTQAFTNYLRRRLNMETL